MIVLDFEGFYPRLTVRDVIDQVRTYCSCTVPMPYQPALAVNGIVIKLVPGYSVSQAAL